MKFLLPETQCEVVLDSKTGEVGFVPTSDTGALSLCCLYTSFFARDLTRRVYSSQLDAVRERALFATEVDILHLGEPLAQHQFLVAADSLEEAEDLACPLVMLYAEKLSLPSDIPLEILACASELAEPELRFIRDHEAKPPSLPLF